MLANAATATHPDEIEANQLKALWLDEFTHSPSVYSVCKKLGISRTTVYNEWMRKDVDFATQFGELRKSHIDGVEGNLLTQALRDEKAITAQIFTLKCWLPEKYGDRFQSTITLENTMNFGSLANNTLMALSPSLATVVDEPVQVLPAHTHTHQQIAPQSTDAPRVSITLGE